MRIQKEIVLSFAIALMIISAASAQGRRMPWMPEEVGVAITLQVAGQPYRFDGKAVCQHAPVGSIYDVVAERWSIQQSDGQRSVGLNLWRPKKISGDMFSLDVTIGGKSYRVNTVTAGGTAVQGSGKVTLTTSGAGGTFTINATAANGAAITGTIKCSAFTDAVAVGGH